MNDDARIEQRSDPGIPEQSPERHRPLLTAAVAFAVGVVVARYLDLHIGGPLFLGAVCVACAVVLRRRIGGGLESVLVLILVGAAGAATEAYHTDASRSRARDSLVRVLNKRPTLCTVRGTVVGERAVTEVSPLIETGEIGPREISTFRVSARQIEANGRVVEAAGDVTIVASRELPDFAHGDEVRVFGWIKPLDPGRSSDRYAASRGIVARMSAPGPGAVAVEQEGAGSLLRFLYALKRSFRRQIDGAGFSEDTTNVLKAALLGDRERLGRRLAGAFNKSGTTHILAISGLHVGIVYGAIFWLCRMLLIQRWRRRVIVLGVVCSYALMIGLRPATVRAVLMITLFEIGDWLRFFRDPVNAVAGAALIILALAPQHLFEAGFQLTFVAVLGILMFAPDAARFFLGRPGETARLVEPELRGRLRGFAGRVKKSVVAAVVVCAAATMCVAPLQAYYFNVVTPVSILATALLVPVISTLISLGFLFLALAPFVPFLAGLAANALAVVAALFVGVVEFAAALPFGHAFVAPPPAGWVALFYASLLVAAARKWIGLGAVRAAAVPACVLCVYLGWRALIGPGPELAATFVDVGHGMCVVVTGSGSTVMCDCGSGTPFSTYDVGKGPAASCLWNHGIKRIDLLLLSHTDADHVNGVFSLMDRFRVGMVVANKSFGRDEIGKILIRTFRAGGVPFQEVGDGDRITLPGLDIKILWPPKNQAGWRLNAVNDRSLVARITSGGRSLLLTADIEQAGMRGLMATHRNLCADVLYVPHHGACDPALPRLIRAVRPGRAVISAERGDDAVRKKVAALFRGVWLYQTFLDGNVRLETGPAGWRARTAGRGRP